MRNPLWIFGYGSLMWRPDFEFEERRHARLSGYRRCFCIYSTHHRGNAARPGMVLGLDRGGSCDGIAYRIHPDRAAATLAYLRAREQVNGVYREVAVPITLSGHAHETTTALAYVVERWHPSYAGSLHPVRQAQLIRAARGISGLNLDYLINTVSHLAELGIRERELERVLALAGALFVRAGGQVTNGARPGSRALHMACSGQPIRIRRMRPGERRRFTYRRQIAQWAAIMPPTS